MFIGLIGLIYKLFQNIINPIIKNTQELKRIIIENVIICLMFFTIFYCLNKKLIYEELSSDLKFYQDALIVFFLVDRAYDITDISTFIKKITKKL